MTSGYSDEVEREIQELCLKVFNCLKKFHEPGTPQEERQQINAFISKEFPENKHSWEVLNRFLKNPNIGHIAHFYAANIFRKKLCRHFDSIPRHSQGQVRDTMINFLLHFKDFPHEYHNVRTQLSIGISHILIQRPDWTDSIKKIIQVLAKPDRAKLLLNFLTIHAEEIYGWKLPLPDKLKRTAKRILEDHAESVLNMLDSYFQAAGENVNLQLLVFKCFNKWIFVMENVNNQLLGTSKLSACLFKALKQEKLFQVAADSISKMLRLQGPPRYDTNNDEETSFRRELWKKSFHFIVPNVIETIPQFQRALQAGEFNIVENLAKIYVDTGETYLEWITEGSDRAKTLLRGILEATKLHKKPEISVYTLYFWDRFLDPFVREVKLMKPEHIIDDFGEFPRNWDLWAEWFIKNVFPELVPALVLNCEYPENVDDLNPDELDVVCSHRWHCSDQLAKIAKILGSRSLLTLILRLLKPMFDKMTNGFNTNENYDNARIEAILFAIRSNYKVYTNPDEHHPLYDVFRIIPQLPDQHYRTKNTGISLIGRHCNFLKVHDPVFVTCMKYICGGFEDSRTSNNAANCIRSICEYYSSNDQFVKLYLDNIFKLYENSFQLPIADACELTVACVEIVRYQESYDVCSKLLKKLLDIPVSHLDKMLQAKSKTYTFRYGQNTVNITMENTMKRVSTIWKYMDLAYKMPLRTSDGTPLQPILVYYFRKLWPLLREILKRHNDDDDIMEKTTRCIKHTIRFEAEAFSKIEEFDGVLRAMAELYQQSPRSCFLYILAVYVDEYGDEREMEQALTRALDVVSQRTFRMLSDTSKFVEYPEIVEDYFELVVVYIKRMPTILLGRTWIDEIFRKALDGVLLEHKEASEAVLNFYRHLIVLGDKHSSRRRSNNRPADAQFKNRVLQILRQNGSELVKRLLQGISYEVGFGRVGKMTEVFEEFFRFDKELLIGYMRENIQKIQVHPIDPSKEEFVDDFERSRDKRDRRKCITDFWRASERYVLKSTY